MLTWCLGLVLLLWTLATTYGRLRCTSSTWQLKDDQCYYFQDFTLQFQPAQASCKALNSVLTSIHSDEETNFVLTNMKETLDEGKFDWNLWLGLVENNNGEFIWLDGTDFNYTNWANGEPNDRTGNEINVEMYTRNSTDPPISAGQWNDVQDRHNYVVCKQPAFVGNSLGLQTYLSNGFTTSDNATLSAECIEKYSREFYTKATKMASRIKSLQQNGTLCNSSPDTSIISFDSTFSSRGTEGMVTLTWKIAPSYTSTIDQDENCVEELTNFTSYHKNWPDPPILGRHPGCPDVWLDGINFTPTDQNWICRPSPSSSEQDVVVFGPSFTICLGGGFIADTSEDISQECIGKYSLNLQSKANDMVFVINDLLQGGQMCNDASDGGFVAYADVTVVSSRRKGNTEFTFIFNLNSATSLLNGEACANDVSKYLQQHQNWGQPIIGGVPGCPIATFKPERFWDSASDWSCVAG